MLSDSGCLGVIAIILRSADHTQMCVCVRENKLCAFILFCLKTGELFVRLCVPTFRISLWQKAVGERGELRVASDKSYKYTFASEQFGRFSQCDPAESEETRTELIYVMLKYDSLLTVDKQGAVFCGKCVLILKVMG